jgi:hypothetical protein
MTRNARESGAGVALAAPAPVLFGDEGVNDTAFDRFPRPGLAAIPFNELFQKIEPPAMMVFA